MTGTSNQAGPARHLSGVIAAYNAKRPGVLAIRANNRKQLAKTLAPPAIVVALAAIAAFVLIHVGVAIAVAVLGGIGVSLAYLWKSVDADEPADSLHEEMRKKVLPAIFDDIEAFNFEANVHGFLDEIPAAILPSHDKGKWGDLVEGRFRGRRFAINEMRLISEARSSSSKDHAGANKDVTVFKGVAVRATLSRKVPATLIVRANRAALSRWLAEKMGRAPNEPHIETGDAAFDKRHDLHCRDAGFARKVFSDRGIARFAAIEGHYSSGNLQFVASGRTLTMMIDQTHDFFEIPPIERPFDDVADVARLRDEIDGFLQLIDDMERLLAAD